MGTANKEPADSLARPRYSLSSGAPPRAMTVSGNGTNGAPPSAPRVAPASSLNSVADAVAVPVEPESAWPQPKSGADRGPVGTGEHVVKEGECISSIAQDTGHFWQTLWDDPTNTELRNVRKDRSVLLPGDRVHVPPLREKREVGDAEMRHRFRRKGQPEVLRVRVLRDGEPRGNEPYTLDVDGTRREGTTDAEGKVAVPIPGNARRAKLSVGRKSDVEEYVFTLGAIDPIDEISGVQGRLNNLGFDCGPVDGKWGPQTEKALKDYQGRRRLPVTGAPDEATRGKLVEEYGC